MTTTTTPDPLPRRVPMVGPPRPLAAPPDLGLVARVLEGLRTHPESATYQDKQETPTMHSVIAGSGDATGKHLHGQDHRG